MVKSFQNTPIYQKFWGGVPPPPLVYPRGGINLRERPRVKAEVEGKLGLVSVVTCLQLKQRLARIDSASTLRKGDFKTHFAQIKYFSSSKKSRFK